LEAQEFVDAAQHRLQLFLTAAFKMLDIIVGGWKYESIAPCISIRSSHDDGIVEGEGYEKVPPSRCHLSVKEDEWETI